MSQNSAVLSRATVVAAGGIAVFAALRLAVWLAPAVRPLARPVYWIVAVVVLVGIWHVTRPRSRKDRRHEDRRGS